MAYATEDEIKAILPARFLTEALDDDENGTADTSLLTNILAVVDNEVNALITQAADLPLSSPYPALIRNSALVLACEALYRRRGIPDEGNPFAERAEATREDLKRVGRGELALDTDSAVVAGFNDHTLAFDDDATE